jgi:hypothetical protein
LALSVSRVTWFSKTWTKPPWSPAAVTVSPWWIALTEPADLSPFDVRRDEVDDLDACLKNLLLGLRIFEWRRLSLDGAAAHSGIIVYRIAETAVSRFERAEKPILARDYW